jgi:hypothetical protein
LELEGRGGAEGEMFADKQPKPCVTQVKATLSRSASLRLTRHAELRTAFEAAYTSRGALARVEMGRISSNRWVTGEVGDWRWVTGEVGDWR